LPATYRDSVHFGSVSLRRFTTPAKPPGSSLSWRSLLVVARWA